MLALLIKWVLAFFVLARVYMALVIGAFLALLSLAPGGCLSERGPFTVTIERDAASDFETQLISTAESACPLDLSHADLCVPAFDPIEDGCRWWCEDFEGVLTPYALNAEAIAYYQGRTQNNEMQSSVDPRNATYRSTVFTYTADVALSASFGQFLDVYVVTLNMRYSEICGPLCGHFIWAHRTVVLNRAGEILAIEGDGSAATAIS